MLTSLLFCLFLNNTVLAFIGKSSFDFKKWIIALVKKRYCQIDVKVVLRPCLRVLSLIRLKDHLPNALRSCVIYKFACGGCNATYIGKIKRHLSVRVAEHGCLHKNG